MQILDTLQNYVGCRTRISSVGMFDGVIVHRVCLYDISHVTALDG